jgi:hypothetical protein
LIAAVGGNDGPMLGKRFGSVPLLALLAVLVVAGCSDGEDGAADGTTTTAPGSEVSIATSSTIARPKATSAGAEEFCEVFGRMQTLDLSDPGDEPAAVRERYSKMLELGRDLQAAAPEEIADEVARGLEVTQEVVDSGSREAFARAENRANGEIINQFVQRNCAE